MLEPPLLIRSSIKKGCPFTRASFVDLKSYFENGGSFELESPLLLKGCPLLESALLIKSPISKGGPFIGASFVD